MANMFEQMKQIMQMKSEMKKIKAQLEKLSSVYENGGIKATFKGDFSLSSLEISPEALEELKQGKTDRFVTMLSNVINGGIKAIKSAVEQQSAKMMSDSGMGGGLGGLFGK